MKRILAGFLALLAFGLLLFLSREEGKVRGGLVGKPAPPVVFKTPEGKEVSLSDFKGKVVLVNFWATYCPPCIEELDLFERIYEKYKDKGFVVLAVNMDPKNLKDFNYTYSFPLLIGDDNLTELFPVDAFPTSVLIDREGRVVKVRKGIYRELEEDLKKLL